MKMSYILFNELFTHLQYLIICIYSMWTLTQLLVIFLQFIYMLIFILNKQLPTRFPWKFLLEFFENFYRCIHLYGNDTLK